MPREKQTARNPNAQRKRPPPQARVPASRGKSSAQPQKKKKTADPPQTRSTANRPQVSLKGKGRRKSSPPPEESEDEDNYANTTDPTKVTRPVIDLVDENLSLAWRIDPGNPMCFIFDAVLPGRQFKRGMEWDPNVELPGYGPPPWPDLTESDGSDPGLMPYAPILHR
jgi:hypothetical protein